SPSALENPPVRHAVCTSVARRGIVNLITETPMLNRVLGMDDPLAGRKGLTVLLLGTDQTNNLCDTVIVAFVNLETNRVGLLSVPRDSRVRTKGHGYCKLTEVFPNAMMKSDRIEDGVAAVSNVIEESLGIPIDRYARVDIEGFVSLVDCLGGVELDVEKKMHYRDRSQGLYIDLKPGLQKLDGKKAMQYVRFRNDERGDLGRVERQQKFLKAVSARLGSLGRGDVIPLLGAAAKMRKYADTDLSLPELQALAKIVKDVDTGGVETRMASGTARMIGGASYYVLDLPRVQQDILELQTQVAQSPTIAAVAKVAVLNGCATNGLAREAADKLTAKGFEVTKVGNADSFRYVKTVVQYSPECRDAASRVAAALSVGEDALLETQELVDPEARVQVVLGRDIMLVARGPSSSVGVSTH
ncbi:MAG TPA: LCP family protein, partial [Armatimonadota bacterium]|nr:LCP family protein [Armatimonadota bacterium]